MPDDILADGMDSVRARLQRPEVRKYVQDYMLKKLKRRKLKHYSYAVVASYRADSTFNGKSIEQINLMMGRKHKAKEETQTAMDMMMKGGAGMAFVRNWVQTMGPNPDDQKALSVMFGGGWEFKPTGPLGLQLFAMQHVGALDDLQTVAGPIGDVSANFWSLGAAIVIR